MEDDVDPTLPSDANQANLVFFGPSGCGKSTSVGHLIADCGAIDEKSLERIARDAADAGASDRQYAWILDKLRCERERGGTMFQALWRLRSQRCRFTIIDAPGHDDFTKDIVTAMSQADIAVLVVTAVQADLDVGMGCEVQIREHALLAYTLGLRQIVVCVNKMDCDTVDYSQDHFCRACVSVREALEDAGLKTHDVHFVPISGLIGDNVAHRSDNMPWYAGPTLLEAMDDAVASHFKPEYPLRLPLQDVMQIGGQGVVVVGRVATGSLRPGMELVFAPGGLRAEVKSIRMHHECLKEAVCGESVNVAVDVPVKELRRGMVASAAEDSPASECSSFLAHVIVLPHGPSLGRERTSREIAKDCTLWVECHTAQVPCKFEELLSRTDRRTGQVLELNPQTLRAGDAAVVRLRPEASLSIEAFSEYPPLGRFAVRDQKTTIAVGVVQQVEKITDETPWAGRPAPSMRGKTTSKSTKAHSRHSTTKPKARASPSGGTASLPAALALRASVDDSGEEPELGGNLLQSGLLAGRLPAWPKTTAMPAPSRSSNTVGTDSGEDFSPSRLRCDDVPMGAIDSDGGFFGAPIAPSPFLAFGAAKNPSPFAAFGAVTKKKDSMPRRPRAAGSEGGGGTAESDS